VTGGQISPLGGQSDVGRDVLDILDMVVVMIFWQNIRQAVGGW